METEIWKAHPEYAGIEVSTLGRVRTLDKMVWNGMGTWLMKGRILKPASDKDGYLTVAVKVNDKFISKKVHRLTAQTFIQNPDSLAQVNHKNCNRADNRVSNLEWCTASYNSQYREKFGISNAESRGKPVFAINLTTLEVSRFSSQHEASRTLRFSQGNINGVIIGRLTKTHGYWFVNADEHAVDLVKKNLHDVGKTGLKIKHRETLKMH